MVTLLVELTDKCNLTCRHCFDRRHGGHSEIRFSILKKIIAGAGEHGFETITFTGGEPTLHSHFPQIVQCVYEAGYKYGFVSNGQNFPSIYPQIKPFLDQLQTVTFSLDGATPNSHACLRGDGTFTNLMKAVSICVAKDIPFTFNCVVAAHNAQEIETLIELAQGLGSNGVRFGQLMLTPSAIKHGLALTPDMIQTIAKRIEQNQSGGAYPIYLGPGFLSNALFPCVALQLSELTITCSGHLALCCHLPDYGRSLLNSDTQLDLNRVNFEEAFKTWQNAVHVYRSKKAKYFDEHGKGSTAHLPCWFCQAFSGQLNWLRKYKTSNWSRFVEERNFMGRQRK